MNWFDLLRQALPNYYPAGAPAGLVGYLRGSNDPAVWETMRRTSGRHQNLLLGTQVPFQEEWDAAGVGQRLDEHAITLQQLDGYIVLYTGFMAARRGSQVLHRPWGEIHPLTAETQGAFPASLASWIRNAPRR